MSDAYDGSVQEVMESCSAGQSQQREGILDDRRSIAVPLPQHLAADTTDDASAHRQQLGLRGLLSLTSLRGRIPGICVGRRLAARQAR